MVKTRVTPTTRTISFDVPESYVGHELEILVYSKHELQESPLPLKRQDLRELKGIISAEQAKEMQDYLKKARAEWDRETF
jgi:hypothetical protein